VPDCLRRRIKASEFESKSGTARAGCYLQERPQSEKKTCKLNYPDLCVRFGAGFVSYQFVHPKESAQQRIYEA